MLKELILKYGVDKLNTFTKYPSIKTLHVLGAGEMITDFLNINLEDEDMDASEKIDGTNVRILCYGVEHIIGSRLLLLYHNNDIFYDPTQNIVPGIKDLIPYFPVPDKLTVIYGEFYGGKTTNNAKNYGKEKNGFRVFDVVVYDDLSILDKTLPEISKWREDDTKKGIIYGQNFLPREEAEAMLPRFEFVPEVNFKLTGTSHEEVLESLKSFLPETKVALTESAALKPEGIILRNKARTKIIKVRYEDYERAIRHKNKKQLQ